MHRPNYTHNVHDAPGCPPPYANPAAGPFTAPQPHAAFMGAAAAPQHNAPYAAQQQQPPVQTYPAKHQHQQPPVQQQQLQQRGVMMQRSGCLIPAAPAAAQRHGLKLVQSSTLDAVSAMNA